MKPKPIKLCGRTWNKEAQGLARDFAPQIYRCKKCTHPVVYGYRCTFCGDSNPSEAPAPSGAQERTMSNLGKSTRPLDKSLPGILGHTTKSGKCMIWKGAKGDDGYGHINYQGRAWTVSRLVMVLSGVEIAKNQYACHTCDNPFCINPDHLFPGTNQENIQDAQAKGRVRIAQHGTRSMYHKGCKCSLCLSAEASYARDRRAG